MRPSTNHTQTNTSFTNASTKPFQSSQAEAPANQPNRTSGTKNQRLNPNLSNRSIPQAKKATPRSHNTSMSSNAGKHGKGKVQSKGKQQSSDNYDLQNLINNVPN